MRKESIKGHRFERCGFIPPYQFTGYEKKPSYNPSTGHGGTVCDYCGTYIINVFWIEDGNGKRFKVGSDCVKHLNDTKLVTVVEGVIEKQEKERRIAKRIAEHEALCKEFEACLPTLAKYPHPNDYFAKQGKTLADYYLFTLNRKQAVATAKRIEANQKGGSQ